MMNPSDISYLERNLDHVLSLLLASGGALAGNTSHNSNYNSGSATMSDDQFTTALPPQPLSDFTNGPLPLSLGLPFPLVPSGTPVVSQPHYVVPNTAASLLPPVQLFDLATSSSGSFSSSSSNSFSGSPTDHSPHEVISADTFTFETISNSPRLAAIPNSQHALQKQKKNKQEQKKQPVAKMKVKTQPNYRLGTTNSSVHPSGLTLEIIKNYYHMTQNEAAEALGICHMTLKRTCRFYGLKRWPYRKVQSLLKKLEDLKKTQQQVPLSSISSTAQRNNGIKSDVQQKIKETKQHLEEIYDTRALL